jgi:hypothetical protein
MPGRLAPLGRRAALRWEESSRDADRRRLGPSAAVPVQNLQFGSERGDVAVDLVAAKPATSPARFTARCSASLAATPPSSSVRRSAAPRRPRWSPSWRRNRGCDPETVSARPRPCPRSVLGSRVAGIVPQRFARSLFNFRGTDSPPSQQLKVTDAQLYPHHPRRVSPAAAAL